MRLLLMSSVATTSTKPPQVIKTDIRRVLDRMQVQYRETKSGFECIHLPSIDFSSVHHPRPSRRHNKQGSTGSNDAEPQPPRKSLAKKTSIISFGKKNRDKDREQPSLPGNKEKELPSRPSGGTILTTPSSASSSFFHVSSTAHTAIVDPARSDTLEAASTITPGDELPPWAQSPATAKTLPPIPRDFSSTPQPVATALFPTGEVDQDIFDSIGNNHLAVRFEINIVKVCQQQSSICYPH